MGENPIKKTIKLKLENDSSSYSYYLELKTDGTACCIYVDDYNDKSDEEEMFIYKYSYDNEKETITMITEKCSYAIIDEGEKIPLRTYDELCSIINEKFTVENIRQFEKKYYEKNKDDSYFKEEYPGCDSYEKYEEAFVKKEGFDSFSAFVQDQKQWFKNDLKAEFGGLQTYVYKIEGDKMILTSKFTGLKNQASLRSDRAYISYSYARIEYYNDGRYYDYEGTVDTDNKTVKFVSEGDRKDVITATYTEDIEAETVTINFKDKDYVCKFDGSKYIQVE